jgi:heme exporter protein A
LPDPKNILMTPASVKTLSLKDLSFQRNEKFLFSNINLTLESGDILQILGQNGSGKTTLLRLISTALKPYSGEIIWQGKNVNGIREVYLEDILFLGHQPGLKRLLSAEENLVWWRRLNKTNLRENVYAFEEVGLYDHKDEPCNYLSAGQLKRAALARLCVSEAKLWILDEPFTSIDKEFSIKLKSLIISHLKRGGIVVLATHQDLKIENMKYFSIPDLSGANSE